MEIKNDRKEPCQCAVCNRSREFKKHLETVTDPDAKLFFDNLFNYLYEVEEEVDCQNIYLKNLRTLYPRVSKEITTLETLHRDDADFPEKQL